MELAMGGGPRAPTLGRTCSENRTQIQQMSQVGLGTPQNWGVGREPGWFSVSKARVMQPSGQCPLPGQKGLRSALPCPTGPITSGAAPVPRPPDATAEEALSLEGCRGHWPSFLTSSRSPVPSALPTSEGPRWLVPLRTWGGVESDFDSSLLSCELSLNMLRTRLRSLLTLNLPWA